MEVVPGIYGFANGLLNFVKPLQSLCIWSIWLFDIYQSFVLRAAMTIIKAGLRVVNAMPPSSLAALNTTMVPTGDDFQSARVLNVGDWPHTTPLSQRRPLSVTDFIITILVEFLLVEKYILPSSTIFRVFVFVWSSARYPSLVKWFDTLSVAVFTAFLVKRIAHKLLQIPGRGGTSSVRRFSPYSLQHIDFSSHIRLVNSLVPQIRRRRTFDPQALHSAILHASGANAWSLHDLFAMKRPQITVCSDVQEFCEWFLLWGISPNELPQLTADHKAAAYALGPIARTYVEVHEVLRHLDQLPLLHFDFFTSYRYLTTKGALSDPQVASVLNSVFTKHPSYFEFFAFLSSSWWDVAKSLNGSPSCFPRRFVFRDVAPPYVSPSETTPDGAAAIFKTPSTGQKNTHYSEVVLRSHGQTSVAYWDFVFNAVPPVVDTSLSIRGEFQAMLDPFKVLPITCQNRVGVG
ncbi:hypothetical protein OXX59_007833 [Metschnikowia pulcherrima]